MKNLLSLLLLLFVTIFSTAQEWSAFPVPANAGSGKVWQLQSNISDDFNYTMSEGNRPAAFTNKWYPRYHNNWTGPGKTLWNSPQAWSNGDQLAIQAVRVPGTDQVYCGIITNKTRIRYPVYFEISAKIMNQTLANAFWLLSPDDTQEIDAMEGYGGGAGQQWFAERMHLSHHVFIRNPFQDYQPKDAGSWHRRSPAGTVWRAAYHRYGCYWRDPWHLEYYIDGQLVRTVSGQNMIDPLGYTNGTGLNKEMDIIIDAENQTDWRPGPTDAELQNGNIFWVDWMRVYKPVNGNNNGGGNGGNPLVTLRKGNSTGFAIDGGNGGGNGQNVYLWSYNQNNVNQQWIEINRGGGFYSYQKRNTNFCIDGSSGGGNGKNVKLWACNAGNQNQQFRKINVGNNRIRLQKRNASGFSIDGRGGGSNGQNVHMWASNNNNGNQGWIITQIGTAKNGNLKAGFSESESSESNISSVSIYPNPVTDHVNISLKNDIDTADVIITDIQGKLIYKRTISNSLNEIKTSSFNKGLYLIQVKTSDESFTKKLIVK